MFLNRHDRLTLHPCQFFTVSLMRFLILSNKYRFSLPAAIPLRVWAAS
jgi:hypothetical protein